MKSHGIKIITKNMRKDGKSYVDIAVALNVTRQSYRHLCNYKINVNMKKRDPKQNIYGFNVHQLHREIENIKLSGKK